MRIHGKQLLPYILILLGLCFFAVTYRLGLDYTDNGCGSCFGNQTVQEYRLIIRGVPHLNSPSRDVCAIRGCTIPTRPFFLDLYSIGLTLFVIGIYIALRQRFGQRFTKSYDFEATEHDKVYSLGTEAPGKTTPHSTS